MRYITATSLVVVAILFCATPVLAQIKDLNGNYASEGTGTIGGQPVTEITHWVFVHGMLQNLTQILNIGGHQPAGFVNDMGQQIGFCKLVVDTTLNPPPLPYSTTSSASHPVPQFFMLSPDLALSGGGDRCPYPNSSNQTPLEQYIIEPDGDGSGFSYSEAGDVRGANPVGTGADIMSISGHAIRDQHREK